MALATIALGLVGAAPAQADTMLTSCVAGVASGPGAAGVASFPDRN